MLLEILSIAALGAVGFNSVKDEEHRAKTKKFLDSFVEYGEISQDRLKVKNGEMTRSEFYQRQRERRKAKEYNNNDYDDYGDY